MVPEEESHLSVGAVWCGGDESLEGGFRGAVREPGWGEGGVEVTL